MHRYWLVKSRSYKVGNLLRKMLNGRLKELSYRNEWTQQIKTWTAQND